MALLLPAWSNQVLTLPPFVVELGPTSALSHRVKFELTSPGAQSINPVPSVKYCPLERLTLLKVIVLPEITPPVITEPEEKSPLELLPATNRL